MVLQWMPFNGSKLRGYIGKVSTLILDRLQHVHLRQAHLDLQIMPNWLIQSKYFINLVLFLQLLVRDQLWFALMPLNCKITVRTPSHRQIVVVRMQIIVVCWLVRHQLIGLCRVVLEQSGVWMDIFI